MPAVLVGRREIALFDVEAADHGALAVGDGELLMIADQRAAAPFRLETIEPPARFHEWGEEFVLDLVGPEPVDGERNVDPAFGGADQRIAHLHPAGIVAIHVIKGAKARPRTVDQIYESAKPILARRVEGERLALRFDGEGFGLPPVGKGALIAIGVAIGSGGRVRHIGLDRASGPQSAIP